MFAAGLINGLLGTGGGSLAMPLLYRLYPEKKDAHRWIGLWIFPLTCLAIIAQNFCPDASALPLSLGALLGGAAGALLLDRIHAKKLRLIFSVLLLYSGVRCFFS